MTMGPETTIYTHEEIIKSHLQNRIRAHPVVASAKFRFNRITILLREEHFIAEAGNTDPGFVEFITLESALNYLDHIQKQGILLPAVSTSQACASNRLDPPDPANKPYRVSWKRALRQGDYWNKPKTPDPR